jgi:transcriptional regulator with XRE-family HTH domain
MKTRLQQLMEKEGINPARFAEMVGVQRSSVSHILSGRNNPSLDFIQKIMQAFPTVSSDWLINGTGPIYRSSATQKAGEEHVKPTRDPVQPGDLFASMKQEPPSGLPGQKNQPAVHNQPVLDELPKVDTGAGVVHTKVLNPLNQPGKTDHSEIERIVVFYANRTFKEYLPDQGRQFI